MATTQVSFIARNIEILVDGLSGAAGGFISSLLLHPLENIRTRLQNSYNDYEKQLQELDSLPDEQKIIKQ